MRRASSSASSALANDSCGAVSAVAPSASRAHRRRARHRAPRRSRAPRAPGRDARRRRDAPLDRRRRTPHGVAVARARFGDAHRPALRGRFACQATARGVVVGEQQRATVSLAERAVLQQLDRLVRQVQQPYEVLTATRLRPTRRPTSSRVRPSSSTSAAHARASSIGLRSSRAMFSTSAASSACASSRSRTIAGMLFKPAICAARQRRSPATSS